MTAQTAIPTTAQLQDTELALLRAQLQALADLSQFGSADAKTAPDPKLAAEISLLQKLLGSLLPGLDFPTITPPAIAAAVAAPPPEIARIEAAMARLLQDLVQETNRRIQAEADLVRARAALRSHGFEERDAPQRIPVAPRP